MGWDAPWHWVVLAILVIALFGYKKLPDASRSVGRSLRIFKSELKGLTDDDQKRSAAGELPAASANAPLQQPVLQQPVQQQTPQPVQPSTEPQRTPQMTPEAGPAASPATPPSGNTPSA